MDAFADAQWIWDNDLQQQNVYLDFFDTFTGEKNRTYTLCISAHTQYAVYLNDQYIPGSQCADYETYQIYDQIDLTKWVTEGINRLKITCYYQGFDCSATKAAKPGLIYAIRQNKRIIARSSSDTQVCKNPYYLPEQAPCISGQLGFSFAYDSRVEATTQESHGADVQDKPKMLHARPINPLTFESYIEGKILSQGVFTDSGNEAENEAAMRMQRAALAFRPHSELLPEACTSATVPSEGLVFKTSQTADGIYLVLDFGKEDTGLIELDIDLPQDADILIGTGEHLQDLRVRTQANINCYAAIYHGHTGKNHFLHPFRRYAFRYMQLHLYTHQFTLRYAGMRPTHYEVSNVPFFKCADHLHNKIYETCVRTLQLCMHEHYEDCPTREQALYTMDSRNQMLCGYYTFGEYAFAKQSLRMIAKSIRDDHMLELCSPGKVAITIPAFSAIFLTQVYEYALYSGDLTFVKEELLPVAKEIADEFIRRTDTDYGLVMDFKEEQYWNFYEWQTGLEGSIAGSIEEEDRSYPAPLNAWVSKGLWALAQVYTWLQEPETADYYAQQHQTLNENFDELFWDEDKQCYATYVIHDQRTHFAQLTQALSVWAGVCDDKKERMDHVLSALAKDTSLIPVTPACAIFKYEALMCDADVYGRFVFTDIAKYWGQMLYQNATTFWETFIGADDFAGAGSLCHGWSAIPAYFYFAYALGIKPEGLGFDVKEQKKIITGLYDCRGRIKMPDSTQITFN